MSFRPIWGKPRLVTDWGQEQEERETHWTSLFYDLIVVAAIGAISEPFLEFSEESSHDSGKNGQEDQELTPAGPLMFNALLQFSAVALNWNWLNEITSRFEDESLVGHMLFLIHSFGMAATAAGCVGDLEENYGTLARGVIMARIGLILLHVRPFFYIDRAKPHCVLKAIQSLIAIAAVLWSINAAEEPYEKFRWALVFIIVVDTIWVPMQLLLKEGRLPIHISSFADRVKEVVMVIFGEAIFSVTLKPRDPDGGSDYYLALFLTLWLIYSMALHEYHISPSVEDHALRRSVLAGCAWLYTSWIKQAVLLGAGIGIKRAHFLIWDEFETVDADTRKLLVWGISLTLLCVIAMRSYSFGWGRHPSPDDPPKMAFIKWMWWLTMVLMSATPFLLNATIIKSNPSPVTCLATLGIMMAAIIVLEAALSNGVAYLMKVDFDDEAAYLTKHAPKSEGGYDSITT